MKNFNPRSLSKRVYKKLPDEGLNKNNLEITKSLSVNISKFLKEKKEIEEDKEINETSPYLNYIVNSSLSFINDTINDCSSICAHQNKQNNNKRISLHKPKEIQSDSSFSIISIMKSKKYKEKMNIKGNEKDSPFELSKESNIIENLFSETNLNEITDIEFYKKYLCEYVTRNSNLLFLDQNNDIRKSIQNLILDSEKNKENKEICTNKEKKKILDLCNSKSTKESCTNDKYNSISNEKSLHLESRNSIIYNNLKKDLREIVCEVNKQIQCMIPSKKERRGRIDRTKIH